MATNYINNLTGLFADTYNCGAYGAGNFNENTCSTTGDSSITAPSTGVFGVEAVGGGGAGEARHRRPRALRPQRRQCRARRSAGSRQPPDPVAGAPGRGQLAVLPEDAERNPRTSGELRLSGPLDRLRDRWLSLSRPVTVGRACLRRPRLSTDPRVCRGDDPQT